MATDSTDRLIKAILADKGLKALLKNNWGDSIGTNGLKLWLIQHTLRKGRFYCCHFRGRRKGLTKRINQLKKDGNLHEKEYLLDLIAFDKGQSRPGFGAEVEWSYSKVRHPGKRDKILQRLGIRSNLVKYQKDIEFYYDFYRILAVRPITGVFVGGSYHDGVSIKRWQRGFEALMPTSGPVEMNEMSVLLILNMPRQSEQRIVTYHWQPSQGRLLKAKGEYILNK
jgi:hypothetical protein